MITVQMDKKHNVVDIIFDKEGIEHLRHRLNYLIKHGGPEHEHFMTPSWAGDDLSETLIDYGDDCDEIVNHLKMIYLPTQEE